MFMISIIVPTLNEEATINNLLKSLSVQSWRDFETIVVDGGSKDETVERARSFGAHVLVETGCPEFISRNLGARKARGKILLFTCADVIFPKHLLESVHEKFAEDPRLVALSGPGIPFDAPIIGRIEYEAYNTFRYVLCNLPNSLKRFSTSTNFLAARQQHFRRTGGFLPNDVNADGMMGRQLAEIGKVCFSLNSYVYISARRMKSMGFGRFNTHYLYVLENIFPQLSRLGFLDRLKAVSGSVHKKMHE